MEYEYVKVSDRRTITVRSGAVVREIIQALADLDPEASISLSVYKGDARNQTEAKITASINSST